MAKEYFLKMGTLLFIGGLLQIRMKKSFILLVADNGVRYYMDMKGCVDDKPMYLRLQSDPIDELTLDRYIKEGLPLRLKDLSNAKNQCVLPIKINKDNETLLGIVFDKKKKGKPSNVRLKHIVNTGAIPDKNDLYKIECDQLKVSFDKNKYDLPIPLSLEEAKDYVSTTNNVVFIYFDFVYHKSPMSYNIDMFDPNTTSSDLVSHIENIALVYGFKKDREVVLRIFKNKCEAVKYINICNQINDFMEK